MHPTAGSYTFMIQIINKRYDCMYIHIHIYDMKLVKCVFKKLGENQG